MERLGTVAIVGVGLIGGSVGMTLRARRLADRVIGIGRDPGKLDRAVRLGAIDEAEIDLARGVSAAEVAVICTPVGRIAEDCIAAGVHGPAGLLVTDAGSTKRGIVAAVESSPARSRFVGAHPIAGSEKSGAEAATADLFVDRPCILATTGRTPPDRISRARAFWGSLGCRVSEMPPEDHDRALAFTSHLPHAVASALAGAVPPRLREFAAGAFRDGTRVAAADATLWTEIFLANVDHVLCALDDFEGRLKGFRSALISADADALVSWWDSARPGADHPASERSAPRTLRSGER